MSRFMRTLSFRRKKDRVPESSKPHQWQEDERKVREGTCSFQVRYLGCIEVFESRGMQVCEEAVKALKAKKHRSVWSRMSLRSRKKLEQNKGKYQRAILYVSGDALRVVDEISKGLIVDQTIEKVSFCAPDRNHEKGFAYICRDGTTRRWMCHAFLAVKESGERLSHAVGCAFAICLEKKQKREKEAVQVQFNDKGTSFSRTGSFRQTTITERIADPQSAMIAMPVPVRKTDITHAVERPHATPDMLIRQGSFRGFTKLSETSPFKRQLSLRLNELPSTLDRQRIVSDGGASNGPVITAAIPEVSPTKENEESISAMCQELTQGLTALTDDPFSRAPGHPNSHQHHVGPSTSGIGAASSIPQPALQTNPWANTSSGSEAEAWLNQTATAVGAPYAAGREASPVLNGVSPQPSVTPPLSTGYGAQLSGPQRAPHLGQLRSRTVDVSDVWHQREKAPTLRELSQRNQVTQFQSQQNGNANAGWKASFPTENKPDPFDIAWASKATNKDAPANNPPVNPFDDKTVTKTFEVKL